MHLFLFSFVISLIRRLKAKIGPLLICSAYRPLWGGLLSKSVIYREQVGDYYAFSWFFWKDKLDSRSPNWWHSRVMTDTFINCIQVKPFSLKVAVQLTSWQMFKTSMLDLVYAMSITIRFVTLETFQTLWFFCGPMHTVEDMTQVLDKLTYLCISAEP